MSTNPQRTTEIQTATQITETGTAHPSVSSYEPACPECGWALPETWRLDHDRSRWECRHCRDVFAVHEVLR